MEESIEQSIEQWKFYERPGYFGRRKAEVLQGYDTKFGKDNWRLVWEWGELRLEWLMAIQLYEDGYYNFLKDSLPIYNELVLKVGEVYDNNISNIKSGLDYTKQETPATHLQDIAIRRCMVRFGAWFQGKTVIQIRHNSDSPTGRILSPGRVPFHLPQMIKQPQLIGWWEPNTVEAFYQSNKIIEIKKVR
jgi:hypothetical protein